jgi:hypothetical protein
MMCLKRDNDEGMSFSTHFLVIRQTCICWGLNFFFMLNFLHVLNLVSVFNLLIFLFLFLYVLNLVYLLNLLLFVPNLLLFSFFLIVLNLLLFSFLLIVINFITLKYDGVRDILMTRMASIILINLVMPFSHQLTLKLFFLQYVEFNNQIIDLFFFLGKSLMCELS